MYLMRAVNLPRKIQMATNRATNTWGLHTPLKFNQRPWVNIHPCSNLNSIFHIPLSTRHPSQPRLSAQPLTPATSSSPLWAGVQGPHSYAVGIPSPAWFSANNLFFTNGDVCMGRGAETIVEGDWQMPGDRHWPRQAWRLIAWTTFANPASLPGLSSQLEALPLSSPTPPCHNIYTL